MLLLIDSRDRTDLTNSTSNFTIQLPNTLVNVTSCKLKQVGMNHKIYNISFEYSNNVFKYTELSDDYSLTIPDGFYSPQQLASVLKALLCYNSPNQWTYDVSYSQTSFRFSISCTSLFSLPMSSLGRYMGFVSDNIEGNELIAEALSKIDDPNYLFLDISFLPQNLMASNTIRTSFILSNDVFATEYSGLCNQCVSFSSQQQIKLFTVYLKNRDGTEAQLYGTDFYIILEINQV